MPDFLVWNEAVLTEFFRSPLSAVGRDLARRAIAVESQAKRNASHARPSTRGSGPAVISGRLRSSISWRLGQDAEGMYADIGTNVEYAGYLDGPDEIYDRPFLTTALEAGRV